MQKTVLKFLFSLLLCIVSIEYVKADVVWPTLVISRGMYSIPSIIIGFIIEIVFVEKYMKLGWSESTYVGMVLNANSALFGYLIIIIGGMPVLVPGYMLCMLGIPEQLVEALMYLMSLIFCAAVNVVIEGYVLNSWYKKELKYTYEWLTYANILSVSVAIVYLAIVKPEMHF